MVSLLSPNFTQSALSHSDSPFSTGYHCVSASVLYGETDRLPGMAITLERQLTRTNGEQGTAFRPGCEDHDMQDDPEASATIYERIAQ
jgi:hypothetical protein